MESPINIILDISKNTPIQRLQLVDATKYMDCSINGSILVRRGHLYYIPITKKELNFKEGIYIQKAQNIAYFINIHSIENGQAIIEPILDCNLSHNQQIGTLH